MPANTTPSISVNLLGKGDLSASPYGRIITWAITYGRYILIGTEIVVLLAFLSRFSLDRKNTDLKEEISQKQAIITANLSLEREVRRLQNQLAQIQSLLTGQQKPGELMGRVVSLLPPDVYFESLDMTRDRLSISAVAGSTQGFGQFLRGLVLDKDITDVELGEISKKPVSGIRFTLTAKIGKAETKKK